MTADRHPYGCATWFAIAMTIAAVCVYWEVAVPVIVVAGVSLLIAHRTGLFRRPPR